MRLIDERTAEAYLRETGRIAPGEPVRVRELTGGVSNMVLAVERPAEAFVLKQARPQLRTSQAWFSSVERIWREADVLRICADLLSAAPPAESGLTACTPRILFEDRENYLFAMSAADEPNTVWKQELLAERVDPAIAQACGRLLATLHGQSWLDAEIERLLGNRTLFEQLRVDPYYRALAQARPQAAPFLSRLIESLAAHPRSLVHADFSPKNLLVFRGGLMMVDFETGHYGDPAFDLGFFASHLVLKACAKAPRHRPYLAALETFWQTYARAMTAKIGGEELARLATRGVRHWGACAWARLDGKSPVDYLTDPARRDQMRAWCGELFDDRATDWPGAIALFERRFG